MIPINYIIFILGILLLCYFVFFREYTVIAEKFENFSSAKIYGHKNEDYNVIK